MWIYWLIWSHCWCIRAADPPLLLALKVTAVNECIIISQTFLPRICLPFLNEKTTKRLLCGQFRWLSVLSTRMVGQGFLIGEWLKPGWYFWWQQPGWMVETIEWLVHTWWEETEGFNTAKLCWIQSNRSKSIQLILYQFTLFLSVWLMESTIILYHFVIYESNSAHDLVGGRAFFIIIDHSTWWTANNDFIAASLHILLTGFTILSQGFLQNWKHNQQKCYLSKKAWIIKKGMLKNIP